MRIHNQWILLNEKGIRHVLVTRGFQVTTGLVNRFIIGASLPKEYYRNVDIVLLDNDMRDCCRGYISFESKDKSLRTGEAIDCFVCGSRFRYVFADMKWRFV